MRVLKFGEFLNESAEKRDDIIAEIVAITGNENHGFNNTATNKNIEKVWTYNRLIKQLALVKKQAKEGRFNESLNEGFSSNYDEWKKVLNKNGFEYKWEQSGEESIFYKKYETGVVAIEVWDSGPVSVEDEFYNFNVRYTPYVKVETQIFGLIKKHLSPKSVNIITGDFDFGFGIFKKNEAGVINNFDRLLKSVDKRVSKIKPEWFPASDAQNIFKKEFWDKERGGPMPSKILYRNAEDWTGNAI